MSVNLHEGQSEVYENIFINKSARNSVVCCSRGWGKSYLASTVAMTAIFELMELPESIPNKNIWIIAPTYDQVTDIYWPILYYDLGAEMYAIKASRDLGRFVFPNNVELRLISYESIERMRGKGAYFVVWDEVSSCKKHMTPLEAWEAIIQPCISTRWSAKRAESYGARSPGRALMIGTPKGYDNFYDFYNYRERDPSWKSYNYDYKTSPFLDPLEIERIRHTVDPIQFASEYLASFAESGNNVFYCFDRSKHVKLDVPEPQEKEPLHFFIDFNVGIQATSVNIVRKDVVYTIGEHNGHPDTEQLAIFLKNKYKDHPLIAYPDPTGKAAKSSAPIGRTDFSILQSHGFNIRARTKSPPIVDSVAAVNRMMLSAAGDIRYFIHPRCQGVIRSLERTKWVDKNPDTAQIDKSEGVEHFSDGIRYGIEYLFPIQSGTKRIARGFNF